MYKSLPMLSLVVFPPWLGSGWSGSICVHCCQGTRRGHPASPRRARKWLKLPAETTSHPGVDRVQENNATSDLKYVNIYIYIIHMYTSI